MNTYSDVSIPRVPIPRQVVVSGLLIRLGFTGAAVAAAAIAAGASSQLAVPTALALLAAGVATALLSFRKAYRLLMREGTDAGPDTPMLQRPYWPLDPRATTSSR